MAASGPISDSPGCHSYLQSPGMATWKQNRAGSEENSGALKRSLSFHCSCVAQDSSAVPNNSGLSRPGLECFACLRCGFGSSRLSDSATMDF